MINIVYFYRGQSIIIDKELEKLLEDIAEFTGCGWGTDNIRNCDFKLKSENDLIKANKRIKEKFGNKVSTKYSEV